MAIRAMADIEALNQEPIAQHCAAQTVFDLLRPVAERHADKTAIRFLTAGAADAPIHDLTFRDFQRRVVQAANLFHALGVDGESCASSLLPLLPDAYVALIGAQTAGRCNPINFLLEPAHIVALLQAARCRVLLAPDPDVLPGIWDKVMALRDALPPDTTLIRVGGPPQRPGCTALWWDAALAGQPDAHLTFDRRARPDDTAGLFHTGGTTSAPKLARHTHRGLVLMCYTNALNVQPDDVVTHGLPPFHVGGAHCGGLSPLSIGATIALLTASGLRDRQVVANFWAHLARLRATLVGIVPTAWGAVMTQPRGGHDISALRLCTTGGSSLPLELGRLMLRELGVPVAEGWGMTELHGYGTMSPHLAPPRIGSIGLPLPYLELIVAEVADGRIARLLPPDTIGRVLVRGHQVFGGYVDAAQDRAAWVAPQDGETVPPFSPGGRWLDTGDLGRIDADNYVWLTGRSKDVIIRGGHNIDPALVEEPLYRHPAVQAAAAVGRPDAHAGEVPVAFVQLKPDADVTEAALLDFLRNEVTERAALPAEITLLAELPMTAVGKVFKPALRAAAARAVLERVVAAEVGIAVPVTIEPDPVRGQCARVVLPPTVAAERRAALRAALGRFSIGAVVLPE